MDIRMLRVADPEADIPFVSLVVVRALVRALRELGHAQPLIELQDLDTAGDPARGIPRRLLGRMLQRIASERNDPVLGLNLASRLSAAHFHVAGLLIMNAETGRQAVEWFLMLRRTLLGGPAWKLVEDDGPRARLGFEPSPLPGAQLLAQLSIALAYRSMTQFWGPSVESALEARFAGATPCTPEKYRPLFGPRVRFEAPRHELVFPRMLLDTRRLQADAALAGALQRFVVQSYGNATSPQLWSRRVRDAIADAENLREISSVSLAERLQISPRTLRRRLAAEGTSFRALLDAVRMARAKQLLARGERTLDEIALEVGYLEANAFRRAFKANTGFSPTKSRHQPLL